MRVARRLLGVLAFSVLFASGYALAGTAGVSLTAAGPEPKEVTVDWGDTVVFSNGDKVDRGFTVQRAGFTSPAIPPGGSFEYRFTGRAGRYNFVQTGTRPTSSGVVVLTATGKVTLKTSAVVGTYGSNVTLSGRSTYGGTPVVVQIRYAGASGDWTTLFDDPAATDGAYSGRFRLTAGGRVRARVAADQVSSEILDLAVRPKLRARVSRGRVPKGAKVMVTALVTPAEAAAVLDLEMLREGRRNWLRSGSKAVSKSGKVTFVYKAVAGKTRLRVALKRGGLEPGFVQVVSKSMLVVGT